MMNISRRRKGMALGLVLAGSLVAPAVALSQAPPPPPGPPHGPPQPAVISVTGQGMAQVAPDMAVVSLSVTRLAETADAALAANNAAMREVMAALKADGIAERDIQTSDFSIYPHYSQQSSDSSNEPSPPKTTGYQVTNALTVKVRDLQKLGGLLDRSVKLGVNQGGQISFTNDDTKVPLTQARRRAVEDAVEKARTLAEAAGVKLGRIVSLEENADLPMPIRPAPMMRMAMAKEADSVPVSGGENTYTVNVFMRFELAP